ncbi:MAG: type IVB secretion system protein IcmH/DotU [Rhizobacter sp.]|nr:type IVB secretion system protein IcmH/DotU [Rhizobacter sp.]
MPRHPIAEPLAATSAILSAAVGPVAPSAPGGTDGGWDGALHAAARPLIALATQLRSAVPPNPTATCRAVHQAVADFERRLTASGCHERTVVAASYVLCVWLDEVIAPHGWAAGAWGGEGLLAQFHHETDGRRRVFQLLDKLLQQPSQDRALLELFHACLSLGLQGQWQDAPDGPRHLEALRQRVARALGLAQPNGEAPPLSARWQPVSGVRRGGRGWPLQFGAVLLCALGATGVYVASQWSLARQVDDVFAQMQGLEAGSRGSVRTATAMPAAAAPGRLSVALAAALQAGQIDVRDEVNRSLLVLGADGLFEPASARLADPLPAPLGDVAAALAKLGGRVLVTAYAHPDADRPAHLVSASQLADTWAAQVQRLLQQQRPAGTVDAEGRAAEVNAQVDRPPTAPAARSRIEIVWFR